MNLTPGVVYSKPKPNHYELSVEPGGTRWKVRLSLGRHWTDKMGVLLFIYPYIIYNTWQNLFQTRNVLHAPQPHWSRDWDTFTITTHLKLLVYNFHVHARVWLPVIHQEPDSCVHMKVLLAHRNWTSGIVVVLAPAASPTNWCLWRDEKKTTSLSGKIKVL